MSRPQGSANLVDIRFTVSRFPYIGHGTHTSVDFVDDLQSGMRPLFLHEQGTKLILSFFNRYYIFDHTQAKLKYVSTA